MKNSSDECTCEFHKNNEIFSDAIHISWDLLRRNNFFYDGADERVSRTSAYLGVEIFEAIKNIREKFMNESMCVNTIIHQKVLVTQQKTAKTSGSKVDITESYDYNISNSIDGDEEQEVFKRSEIDSNEFKNNNFESEVENHDNDNEKLNTNRHNTNNYSTNFTSAAIEFQNDSHQVSNITDDSDQALYEKVLSVLNELTLVNVDELTKQVKALNINSHEKLQGVVDLVFDKAIDEPNLAYTYATMCRKLSGIRSHVVDIQHENKADFRALFLARCEHVFESTAVNEVERNAKLQEIEECIEIKKKKKLIALLDDANRRLCKKSVGNIRLIGELFNQNMLRVAFIHKCIKHLLRTPIDYNVECLCNLLTATGAKLANTKDNNFDWYFGKMYELAKRKTGPKKLSSRLRYMLYDVINLKTRNWESIKYKNNTIKQPYAVATSTSMELLQCTSATKNYRSDEKALNSSSDIQNDSHQRRSSKSENAGESTTRFQTCRVNDDSETQAFYEEVRNILSKLIPENIDKLTKQVKLLNINSHEKLQGIVDLIFDKAIDEPNFANTYAIMCKKLTEIKSNVVDIRQENTTNFRTLLLARCEYEFEKTIVNGVARRNKLEEIDKCNDIEKKKKLIASLNDDDNHLCRESVGSFIIIGELFNHTMLTMVFIKKCLNHLLTTLDEHNVECFCELLKTIGTSLKNKYTIKNNFFDNYFSKMTELVRSDDKISSRVRFMLQDVIDLRAQNWKPGVERNPITMNQVSEESSPSRDESNKDVVSLVPTPSDKKILTENEIMNEMVIIFQRCESFSTANSFVDTFMSYLKNKLDSSTYPYFIRELLNMTFGRASIYREYYSSLFAHMIINNMFPLSLFQSEYDKLLELPKNLFIDFPVFWTYLAETLKPLILLGAHPLNELVRTTSVLKSIGLVGKLVGKLLCLLAESKGLTSLADEWNASGIKLTDLIDTSLENSDDIVEQYNLQFLTNDATEIIPSGTELTYEQINKQLLKLLRDYDFDDITSWITANVGQEGSKEPKFIRTLFTSILETVIEPLEDSSSIHRKVNRQKVDYFFPLVQRYVDKHPELELQCLYALTAFNYKLENPRGFLSPIIDAFYELGVVSDKVFLTWQTCPDKAEMLGHGCAVLALSSFFVQLKENLDESCEEY